MKLASAIPVPTCPAPLMGAWEPSVNPFLPLLSQIRWLQGQLSGQLYSRLPGIVPILHQESCDPRMPQADWSQQDGGCSLSRVLNH